MTRLLPSVVGSDRRTIGAPFCANGSAAAVPEHRYRCSRTDVPMRYDFPAIQTSHTELNSAKLISPTASLPVALRKNQGSRFLKGIAACLIVAGHSVASDSTYAQSPDPRWIPAPIVHPLQGFNRLGRLMGWGVSDGYHAATRGNPNPLHDLPPRTGWIGEPSGLVDHPAAARIRQEIHSVNQSKTGFYDPYIDYSMASPEPSSLANERNFLDTSQKQIHVPPHMPTPFQPSESPSEFPHVYGTQSIAPVPLHSQPSPIPVPAPAPRIPKQAPSVPKLDPNVKSQEPLEMQAPRIPSILDSLPEPQLRTQQIPQGQSMQNPPRATPVPTEGGYSANGSPINGSPTDAGLTDNGINVGGGSTPIAQPRAQGPLQSPAVDPLSVPILPQGTIDPLPDSPPPRGNLLREPAVPPGVDPLEEFRRSSAELRQTSNIKQRSAPKRIPRITNRIIEPVAR